MHWGEPNLAVPSSLSHHYATSLWFFGAPDMSFSCPMDVDISGSTLQDCLVGVAPMGVGEERVSLQSKTLIQPAMQTPLHIALHFQGFPVLYGWACFTRSIPLSSTLLVAPRPVRQSQYYRRSLTQRLPTTINNSHSVALATLHFF
jgi:hypothetical protein